MHAAALREAHGSTGAAVTQVCPQGTQPPFPSSKQTSEQNWLWSVQRESAEHWAALNASHGATGRVSQRGLLLAQGGHGELALHAKSQL